MSVLARRSKDFAILAIIVITLVLVVARLLGGEITVNDDGGGDPSPLQTGEHKYLHHLSFSMCILSDGDILQFMRNGFLSIEPFVEKNLTPNGCDLRIGELFFPDSEEHIKEGTIILHPGKGIAVATMEYVKLSGEVTAQLWLRSSFARKGLLTSFGKVDSGFEGALTIPLYNSSGKPFELRIGDRLLQIVFEKMHSPPLALYDERSGHYQGSVGITLEQFTGKGK